MNKYTIRHSEMKDITRIMEIYEYARHFMAEQGLPLLAAGTGILCCLRKILFPGLIHWNGS